LDIDQESKRATIDHVLRTLPVRERVRHIEKNALTKLHSSTRRIQREGLLDAVDSEEEDLD
jgi:DNA-directed RNA polymerase sigma subunit (sigma70/sigma32)